MIKKVFIAATLLVAYIIFSEGCYYHKADQEYPSSGNGCDTINVRYSVEIRSILDANCKTCHNGTNSISGIDLYDYTTISTLALDGHFTYGTLLSAVMHEGGAPMMPLGLPQLEQCDINKIAAWVHEQAPNN
jgi:mono/diheme cytochrome c family protein